MGFELLGTSSARLSEMGVAGLSDGFVSITAEYCPEAMTEDQNRELLQRSSRHSPSNPLLKWNSDRCRKEKSVFFFSFKSFLRVTGVAFATFSLYCILGGPAERCNISNSYWVFIIEMELTVLNCDVFLKNRTLPFISVVRKHFPARSRFK